jgi:hypothetical protein
MSLENRKSDKSKELVQLLHKSIEKVRALRDRQTEEMATFEDTEQTAIMDKRKRLHYESIRIEEIKREVKAAKDAVTERMQKIEEKVFEDTKPLQEEKKLIEGKIDVVEREIEEIEQLLEKKR